MNKIWKKSKRNGTRTYDTDRYELFYHYIEGEDGFTRSVWPTRPLVGPEEFNRSHIDLVVDPVRNRCDVIVEEDKLHRFRKNLAEEKVKFMP